jgi:hypothetical protein
MAVTTTLINSPSTASKYQWKATSLSLPKSQSPPPSVASSSSQESSWTIWQSGKKHPIYGTPLLQPYLYAWVDLIIGAAYTPFALTALTGTAQKVYATIGVFHFMLLILTDYATYIPINVPEVPLIYMNMLDYFVVGADITLPFLIDGFGDGALKIAFPCINLILGPLLILLDPTPATGRQKLQPCGSTGEKATLKKRSRS